MVGATGNLIDCLLSNRARQGDVVSNRTSLLRYLRVSMAFAPREMLRIIHLDAGNRIVTDEVAATGTVDSMSFYVREVVARALEVGAVGLILVHNHPSGRTAFTTSDIQATRELAAACLPLGMVVEDHLVVATDGVASMRDEGHLA